MFKWFSPAASPKAEQLLKILTPRGVGILSASCCNPLARPAEDALQANLREACARAGVDAGQIYLATLTEAQAALPQLMAKLNPSQAELAQKLMTLFMTSGLDAFPVLLIGGQIAFYGGVPEVPAIEEKLRQLEDVSPPAVAIHAT